FPQTPVAALARGWRVKTNGLVGKKARNIKKCVVAPAVGFSGLVVLNSLDVHTHLDGMSSLDICEIVTCLEEVISVHAGRAVIHSDEIQRAAAVLAVQPLCAKRDSAKV